jgi:hypothetical protein
MLAEAAALVLARRMYPQRVFPWFAFLSSLLAVAAAAAEAPRLPGVGAAMQQMVAQREIAGAVTVVIAKDRVLHLESTGFADVATQRAMTPDTLFNIMSMTKPVTAVALLMLQDEGKLRVSDPVAKFIPEFAALKTPSGQPANLTIAQLMTHTSGLGEAGGAGARDAHTLADLVPLWLAAPMQYEPGAKWRYTQSGINCACAYRGGRERDVVSGFSRAPAVWSAGDERHDADAVRRAGGTHRDAVHAQQGHGRFGGGPSDAASAWGASAHGQRGPLRLRRGLRALLPDVAQRRGTCGPGAI